MIGHIPTTDQVRLAHAESVTLHTMEEPALSEANAMFDRWLAAERLDAQRQAGATTKETFTVCWFPPDGDKEKSFTTESAARRHAAKRDVGDWNPMLVYRVRVIDDTDTILPLAAYDPSAEEA